MDKLEIISKVKDRIRELLNEKDEEMAELHRQKDKLREIFSIIDGSPEEAMKKVEEFIKK